MGEASEDRAGNDNTNKRNGAIAATDKAGEDNPANDNTDVKNSAADPADAVNATDIVSFASAASAAGAGSVCRASGMGISNSQDTSHASGGNVGVKIFYL